MKILITGKSGYIANAIYAKLKDQHDISLIGRGDFDLSNSTETRIYFQNKYFDVVIHTAVSGGSRLRKDTSRDMDVNLLMYYNLLQNRLSYGKLIHFGSGAEIHMQDQPYGLSKHVISKSIEDQDNFYNLRIYAVFDENELNTRFVKTCIHKYINKEDMELFIYKKMDFIYMPDLINIVEHYIHNNNLPKQFDCVYKDKLSLLEIALMINNLSDYKVAISSNNNNIVNDYIGEYKSLGIDYIGLQEGIRQTYNKLK